MHIWIGCLLPEEFEKALRVVCAPLGQELGLDTVAFSLPQHISLKISFPYDGDVQALLDYLTELLKNQPSFTVHPKPIERQGNILWIPFAESGQLRQLHNLLDRKLKKDHGVPQHIFDKAFLFHSTLFFGAEDKLEQARRLLQSFPMPQELRIGVFVIGTSETGQPGTYRVVHRISL